MTGRVPGGEFFPAISTSDLELVTISKPAALPNEILVFYRIDGPSEQHYGAFLCINDSVSEEHPIYRVGAKVNRLISFAIQLLGSLNDLAAESRIINVANQYCGHVQSSLLATFRHPRVPSLSNFTAIGREVESDPGPRDLRRFSTRARSETNAESAQT